MMYTRSQYFRSLYLTKQVSLHLWTRHRSGWGKEYHNHDGVRYIHVWGGNPHRHKWWAFSFYLYFSRRHRAV